MRGYVVSRQSSYTFSEHFLKRNSNKISPLACTFKWGNIVLHSTDSSAPETAISRISVSPT